MTNERQGITPPPVLGQDDLAECLRWSAFKMCGRGHHENYASDAITMALERIAELEAEVEKFSGLTKLAVLKAYDTDKFATQRIAELEEALIGVQAAIEDIDNPFNEIGSREERIAFEMAIDEASLIVSAALGAKA